MGRRERSWQFMRKLGTAHRRQDKAMDEEALDPYNTGSKWVQMKPEDSLSMFPTYSEADKMLKRKARAKKGSTWRFRRTACCNCGAQYSPQWRSGPEGPRTLCNACGVRYKKGLPLGCPMPSAQEPGVPAEPMEVQLSAEGTPGASSICMASPMSMPGEIPEPYSPDVSELEMHSGNSDEEGPARGNQWEEAHDGTEAHDGAAAQSDAGVAYPQVEYGQGEHQPAFQAILAKDTRAEQDQQGSAASTHALSHLQGQADALRPVLGIVGLLSMLAALLMPAGKLQYSKMEALAVGIVYGITALHTVILDSIQQVCGVENNDLQHHAWILAARVATGQQDPGSRGGGQASGCPMPRQPLCNVEEPSVDAAARPSTGTSPLFKRVPKRKRSVFVEAVTASSPTASQQAYPDMEQHPHNQQEAALVDAAVRIEIAQEPGMLGQPSVQKAQAVQQAGPRTMGEEQAAAAQAEQQADSPRQAMPGDYSCPLPQHVRAQPYRQTPMPALSTRVQRAQAGSPGVPVAHPSSFLLPPPEEEFLFLQTALMPSYEAEPAGAPGMQSDKVFQANNFSTDEDEEIDIMTVSPRAEQPPRRYLPDQAAEEAQLLQRCELAGQPPSQLYGLRAQRESEAAQALLPAGRRPAQYAHVALRHEAQGTRTLPHADHPAVQHAGTEEEIDIMTLSPQPEQPMRRRFCDSALQDVQGAQVVAQARTHAKQHAQVWAQQPDWAKQAAQQAVAAVHDGLQEREHQEALQTMSQHPWAQQAVQQHTQGAQGPSTVVLLAAGGQVEGEGGITYSRDVYSTREDPTERLLDMRELAKAVGWAQLFMSKASTRDMCAVLWTLISQQAAREGPPHFLLSGAPREHRVFSPVHRVRYLLRLSQIRTLYWISDEADRGLLDVFCKDVWAGRVYEWSMQSVRVYEAQDAGQSGQELAKPARTRGIKTLFAPKHRHEKASATKNALETASAPLQSKAVDVVSHSASASSRGKAGGRPDLTFTQQEPGSGPAPQLQLPAGMPSHDTASHADARCLVTFQPRQLGPQQTLDSARRQGIYAERGESCTPALKTEQQQNCVQAGVGCASVPRGEACTATGCEGRPPQKSPTSTPPIDPSAAADSMAGAAQDVWPGQSSMGMLGTSLQAGNGEQARASCAVSPSTALTLLPAAKQGDTARQPPDLKSMQLSSSSHQANPEAEECRGTQQAAPGSDHRLQEPQREQAKDCSIIPGASCDRHGDAAATESMTRMSAEGPDEQRAAASSPGSTAVMPEAADGVCTPAVTGKPHNDPAATDSVTCMSAQEQRATAGTMGSAAAMPEAAQFGSTPAITGNCHGDPSATVGVTCASAQTPGEQHAAASSPSNLAITREAVSTPAITGKRHADADPTMRMTRAHTQRADQLQAAPVSSPDIAGMSAGAKTGSTPAITGTRPADSAAATRMTRGSARSEDAEQSASGAQSAATAVQSASVIPRCARSAQRPPVSAPCLYVDGQRNQVHEQLGTADPREQPSIPGQLEHDPAEAEPPDFNLKRDLRRGCTVLIRTEEDDANKGWDKPWSVGIITWLRKDKRQADVHWLQPEPKEGMWGSKWVPFEVDVWTPKKSRTERVPWRSEYLDTECFVWGSKLKEDATFTPEDQARMARAAKYVEDTVKSMHC